MIKYGKESVLNFLGHILLPYKGASRLPNYFYKVILFPQLYPW